MRGLATCEGHRRWVEYKQYNVPNIDVQNSVDEGVDGDDGDENEEGGDNGWDRLHHDTKCVLQEFWGETDGDQVDTHEE